MTDLELVLRQHGAALARVAALYSAPGADREDLLQDVCLALVGALPRFRGDSSLKTYVLRVAHNCGARRLARRPPSGFELNEQDHFARGAGPEQTASTRRDIERLQAALRCLPIGSRQVLGLALEGMSHTEIAETLGLEVNAVAVRLHRARKNLKSRLEDSPPSSGKPMNEER